MCQCTPASCDLSSTSKGLFTNYVYRRWSKNAHFCQHSYHRKCQRRRVGRQKKTKSCQRSLWTTQTRIIDPILIDFHYRFFILIKALTGTSRVITLPWRDWMLLFRSFSFVWNNARTYLQLPLRQWGAGNVYLLVLSSWKVNNAENPIAVMGL